MDSNDPGKRLPLPVKEIVRNLRKSLKTEIPRARRSSDLGPAQSQISSSASSLKARWPLTPAGLSSTPFFPQSCSPATFNSSKQSTAANKMDMFIPSPGFGSHFASSPLASIYGQEKSGNFCGTFSNVSMDSAVSDDICEGLDDNLEDGSLENLLTDDVINTLHQTAAFNSSPEFTSWAVKLESDAAVEDCLSTNSELTNLNLRSDANSELTNLNLRSDAAFGNGIMNIGHHDYTFCNNNMNEVSSNLNSPALTPGLAPTDMTRLGQTYNFPHDLALEKKSFPHVASAYSQNPQTLRNHFPPRAAQPQVGVAAVISKGNELGKLKQQTPQLHKLLSIKPEQSDLKSELFSPTESHRASLCHASAMTDRSAQIVPSSACAVKRTHSGSVKSEPEYATLVPRTKDKSMEEKWQDVQSFMHSPEHESAMSKRRRCDSGSSEHISDDDDDDGSSSFGDKDQDDSDDDYSDIDADLANLKPSECESLLALGKKQKQFFWQYNIQSKGPKGTRLKLAVESPADPHVLNNFEDPVFDVCNTTIAGIRHGGKARKGDGNEITPNPKKLVIIGHQLMRLNHQINACQLGSDVPLARRNESRKEKNKLASRACRLKKKAQHEANKIKLYGLEQEHSQLNTVLQFIWPHIRDRAQAHMRAMDKLSSTSGPLTSMLESQISHNLKSMIAGHTVDYVNSVILKVESGDSSGGLNIKKSQKT